MRSLIDRLSAALRKFMYGRYGTDQMNLFLVVLCPVAVLISYLIPVQLIQSILVLISYAALIYAIFRMMSRNYERRCRENEWFLDKTGPLVRMVRRLGRQIGDREYKYFKCPGCGQELRAPRKHGKIKIRVTCQKCGTVFTQRT